MGLSTAERDYIRAIKRVGLETSDDLEEEDSEEDDPKEEEGGGVDEGVIPGLQRRDVGGYSFFVFFLSGDALWGFGIFGKHSPVGQWNFFG
jgi:hypothetical protein